LAQKIYKIQKELEEKRMKRLMDNSSASSSSSSLPGTPLQASSLSSSSSSSLIINQSIKIYIAPHSRSLLRGAPDPGQAEKNSLEKVVELRIGTVCALDQLEGHSRLLDQPQKKNGSALAQSGRMGPPNYREQRTAVQRWKPRGGRSPKV